MFGRKSIPPPPVEPADLLISLLPTLIAVGVAWLLPALFYLFFSSEPKQTPGPGPEVGMGYTSEPISGLNEDALWDAMVAKIKSPEKFLPVGEVTTKDMTTTAGPYVWRTMTFMGRGPMQGNVIVENIYTDRRAGELRFVLLDADGNETDSEVINALIESPTRIRYYKRTITTQQSMNFPAPRAGVAAAIAKTVELAKADARSAPRPRTN